MKDSPTRMTEMIIRLQNEKADLLYVCKRCLVMCSNRVMPTEMDLKSMAENLTKVINRLENKS